MRPAHRRLTQEPLESRALLSISPAMIDLDSASFSNPSEFVQVGEICYFTAENTDYGRELWATDGTEAGTYLIKDINDGSDSSDPTGLIEFDGKLYFAADDGENGKELWMSDGTESGTVLVKDINSEESVGSSPSDLTVVDQVFYFCAKDADHGAELWMSDGTESGTVLVKDIYTDTYTSNSVTYNNSSTPMGLTDVDGTLFFVAEDEENGLELWTTDGTEEGTVLVADIREGSEDAFEAGYVTLAAMNNTLFFVADDGEHGYELWTSDGTESGTAMVKDLNSGSYDAFSDSLQFAVMDGILYFAADDGEHGEELWRSDGTDSGTYLLKDINVGSNGDLADSTSFTVVDDVLYFSADDGEHGKELWRTDGTEIGTVLVKDVASGSDASYPYYMTAVDGVLYFSAYTDDYGRELWRSDGTETGTFLLADVIAGSIGSDPKSLQVMGDYLMFAGNTDSGYELYSLRLTDPNLQDARLSIWVDGEEVAIPVDIGVYSNNTTAIAYTTDSDGEMTFDANASTTLGDFFEVWRTNAGSVDNNSAATFDSHDLMGNESDSNYTVQMFVNGEVCTNFENYVIENNDEIILIYSDNPVISINTNYGPIVMELFEEDTPITVENFLSYINDGDYLNSIFHRSDPDFMIQGGGYTTDSSTFTGTSQFTEIEKHEEIENESLLSNLYGTVAMARTTDYDSATSHFFINLVDNTFLDPSSSTAHDGYTVFGHVLDMTTAEIIETLSVHNNGSPFGELPYSSDNTLVVVESLEGLGDITGYKFYDTDNDGVFDSDEEGIAGVTVFIDANDNGVLDDGEAWATTDDNGKYLLQAEPGSYTVCAEVTSGNKATVQGVDVTVEIGVVTSDVNFGEIDASAPVGIDDTYTMSEDSELEVDEENGVLFNDTDPENDELTASLIASPQHGAVTFDETGSFKYVPHDDFAGTDTFTYQVWDGTHLSAETTVTINVANVSDPPVAVDDGFEVENDSTSHELDVLNDDYDPDVSDSITILSVTQGSDGGTVSILDGDEVLYRPANGFTGTETFNYTIQDEEGNEATATVTMTVTEDSDGVNTETGNSSLAGYVYIDVDKDGQLDTGELGLPGVLITLNGTSDAGNSISKTLLTDNNGYYLFDNLPAGTYTVTESQPEIMIDGQDSTSDENATVSDDTISQISLDEGESLDDNNFGEQRIQSGYITVRMFFASTSLPEYLRTLVAYGEKCAGNEDLADSISNGDTEHNTDSGNSDTDVNAAPVGEDDSYTVDEDGNLSIDASEGILDNDSDDDEDSLVASLVSGPANGTLSLESDGSFEYEPEANFAGTDTFTYVVYDGTTTSEVVTVIITVEAANDAPVATADEYSIGENNTLTVNATDGILKNDTDIDDDSLSAVLVTGPEHGTLNLSANGSFEYIPAVNFAGTDSFTYYATDDNLTSNTVIVTIEVNEGEDAPIATENTYMVDEDNTLDIDATNGVLSNDTDDDNDNLEAVLVGNPAHGTITLEDDGSFKYEPNANFHGTDSFTYYASDGDLHSAVTVVTITVKSVNDLPVTTDDEVSLSEVAATDINVLVNDTDQDTDDTLTILLFDATSTEGATITLNTDGTLHYDPTTSTALVEGTATSDSFTYTVTDGHTGVAITGTVTITF